MPNSSSCSSYSTTAEAGAAISIVNAIGAGYGATIGVHIPCRVEAALSPGGRGEVVSESVEDKHGLIPACVEYVERFLQLGVPRNCTLSVDVVSKIPTAVGLKSSSAVSVAVVTAVARLLLAREGRMTAIDSRSILELSCDASKSSGASLTGAFDDAVSCLLGGLALTDNTRHRVIRHADVPTELGSIALVRIPSRSKVYTSTVKRKEYSRFKANLADAFALAKRGDVRGAMMLNSLVQCSTLGYSFDPITSAIFEGATCAGVSGKGPAVAALCRTSKISARVERRWKEEGEDGAGHDLKFIRVAVVRKPREYLRP